MLNKHKIYVDYTADYNKYKLRVQNIRDATKYSSIPNMIIPKYRQEIICGEAKHDIAEILKKLYEIKQVQLIEEKVFKDHIHMPVSILPKLRVSEFMAYLKGKSTLMLFDRHPESKQMGKPKLLSKRYYVSTLGNVNETTILDYIREQEENDKLKDRNQ